MSSIDAEAQSLKRASAIEQSGKKEEREAPIQLYSAPNYSLSASVKGTPFLLLPEGEDFKEDPQAVGPLFSSDQTGDLQVAEALKEQEEHVLDAGVVDPGLSADVQQTKRKKTAKRRAAHYAKKTADKRAKTLGHDFLDVKSALYISKLEPSILHPTSLNPSSDVKKTVQGFVSVNSQLDKSTGLSQVDSEKPVSPYVDLLDNSCNPKVRYLVEECGWTYIQNQKGVLQLLADQDGSIFGAKLAQPDGWDAVTDGVEEAIRQLGRDTGLTTGNSVSAAQDAGDHDGGGDRLGYDNKLTAGTSASAAPGTGDPDAGTRRYVSHSGTHHSAVQQHPEHCPTISMGNSFGSGQQQPGALQHSDAQSIALEAFHRNKFVQRWSRHVAGGMAMLFPAHFQLYHDTNLCLFLVDGLIKHHFPHLPFAATSINLGPRAEAREHVDFKNLLFGICALGIFGAFNHVTSGQFCLHQPKVVIELRRGDVFFIPSAAISHSNGSLEPHEVRMSIVCYSAGGMFRWLWQDHQLESKGGARSQESKKEAGDARFKQCWDMFPTIDDLQTSFKDKEPFTGSGQEIFNLIKSPYKDYGSYPNDVPFFFKV